MPRRLNAKQVVGGAKDGAIMAAAGLVGGVLAGPLGSSAGFLASTMFTKNESVRTLAYGLGFLALGGAALSLILGGSSAPGTSANAPNSAISAAVI